MTGPTRTTLLPALAGALALALTACGSDRQTADLGLVSNGPDLPEQCQPCWEDFLSCFDNGTDVSICEDQIVSCVIDCKAPPPPPECDHCAAGFDACTQAAQDGNADPSDCAAGFQSCLHVCEAPEPPPPGDCDMCEAAYLECVNQNGGGQDPNDMDPNSDQDPAGDCQQLLDQCQQQCLPPLPPQPTDCDQCDAALDECLQNASDGMDPASDSPTQEECWAAHDQCLQACAGDPQPVPPAPDCGSCLSQAAECVQNGLTDDCIQGLTECFGSCDMMDVNVSCDLLYQQCVEYAGESTCQAIFQALAQSCPADAEPICDLFQQVCGDFNP